MVKLPNWMHKELLDIGNYFFGWHLNHQQQRQKSQVGLHQAKAAQKEEANFGVGKIFANNISGKGWYQKYIRNSHNTKAKK